MRTKWAVFGIIFIFVFLCCCCLVFVLVGKSLLPSLPFNISTPTEERALSNSQPTTIFIPTTGQEYQLVTATPAPVLALQGTKTPSPVPTVVKNEPHLQTKITNETLHTLEQEIVPVSNLADLAQRLEGKGEIPATVEPPVQSIRIGDRQWFWVANVDTNEYFQVSAVLRYLTDHVYFWIEDGLPYNPDALRKLVETFETRIYPTNRAFFGSEWSPGVDGDEHLYILLASNLGENLAGYFSSADEYHPLAHEYSNAHEMFLLNADNVSLSSASTYGVLAHEFQHMIHWYLDRNETSWINEGFSEIAAFINGYYQGNFDYAFAVNPDLQLNDWPESEPAHYGSSFMFLMYFLDRFGEQATKALVQDPNNGMSSLDSVLTSLQASDPETGELIKADDVFLDWVITNYLQDPSVGSGKYSYRTYKTAPDFRPTETFRRCPISVQRRQVSQYGADYIRFTCRGEYTLRFRGETQVSLLPIEPYSGSYAFWSNRGEESDMTLTRFFDFSNVSGPLTLTYWTWYDIEKDYDYLYLEASLDGENWQILTTSSGTDEDPSGNSYGWGYNGLSGGGTSPIWIQEKIDLSQFAGKRVQLRFEYVTDAAVNGEGFLLDDIQIPEIGYFSDFETDSGGWEAAGWVRIQNILPQTYRLALITFGKSTQVQYLDLSADNFVEIPLTIAGDVNEAVLAVTGTTRFTRQDASYQFEVLP